MKQAQPDPLTFGLGIARRCGDFRLGPLLVYQLNHPDLARQILVDQPEKFYEPSELSAKGA